MKPFTKYGSKSSLNKKTVTVPLLIVLIIAFVFMPLYVVSGQVSVSITTVVPTSQAGSVGDSVRIMGSIETTNGPFQIWFGNTLVASNNAVDYYVDANFTVPELPGGDYTITLKDASKNVNATTTFSIFTFYSLKASIPTPPTQLQEGGTVVLGVALTGGASGTEYYANITVKLPDPLNVTYSRIIKLIASQTGTAHTEATYPDVSFQPSGSNTDLTGLYHAYFNMTDGLAEDQFFIGLTDKSEYHRQDSVAIRAVGYQPNETPTINITYAQTGANVSSGTATASSQGVINFTWIVPSDALIGDYNITITPQSTHKLIDDSQLFTVPGYPIKIRTLNLAGDPLPQILVQALDQATNTIYNGTSGDNGTASVNLEKGSHTIDAFWNDVKVGEISALIIGESAYDLTCELTTLKITVQDKNGIVIPFVSLNITYQYVTTKEGLSKAGQASGQTDLSGTFSFNSALPRISYIINASSYGKTFNTNNNTVSNIPAQPTFQVTVLCPTQTLTLKTLDYNLATLPNARMELVELTSGIFYGAVTNNTGTVSVEVTFGKYRLRIYADDILLNETAIEVFGDTQSEIRCILYNLQLSVIVVDYFGQPIPNANVILHGQKGTLTGTTQKDGTATFSNLIGGNIQVITYLTGNDNSYEAVNLQVEAPTAIQIKMGKYVLLGSFLIETSLLATLIIIFAAVILFLSMEVYTRKRFKPSKSES
jgi:hypothetical protein